MEMTITEAKAMLAMMYEAVLFAEGTHQEKVNFGDGENLMEWYKVNGMKCGFDKEWNLYLVED